MITDFARGRGSLEDKSLEIARRRARVRQIRIAEEAKTSIITGFSENHATRRAAASQFLDAARDKTSADALSLAVGAYRYGTQAVPTARLTVDQHRRKCHVADKLACIRGDQRKTQRALVPKSVDNGSLRLIAERRVFESGGRHGTNRSNVAWSFSADFYGHVALANPVLVRRHGRRKCEDYPGPMRIRISR